MKCSIEHRKWPVTIASQTVPQILFHDKQTKMTISAEIKKGGVGSY